MPHGSSPSDWRGVANLELQLVGLSQESLGAGNSVGSELCDGGQPLQADRTPPDLGLARRSG